MEVAAQRRLTFAVFLFAALASLTASGAVVGYRLSAPSGTILPGVYIAGVHVGQLTPAEAREYISGYLEARVERPITVRLGGESWEVSPGDLGVEIALDRMVSRAYAVGRRGSALRRMVDRFHISQDGMSIPLDLTVDQERLQDWLDGLAREFERPPEDARILVDDRRRVHISPSQAGYTLDREGLAERITRLSMQETHRELRLTLAPLAPAFSTEEARALGIRTMISAFTTEFDPSKANRTQNIRIAAKALDGVIVAPGATFSFNRYVGPRIESQGYKEAPVIVDGELVPDFGGGVCQVSTTLFNAVLLAGVKVSRRVPHSIPASYVPLGRDATVAYDYIDFRFENTLGSHLMIKAWTDERHVTVAFFGDLPSSPSVKLESEIVAVVEPPVTERVQSDLAPGERRVVKEGRRGYQVHVWRVAAGGGQVERQLVSRSVYKPHERVIAVGRAGGAGAAGR